MDSAMAARLRRWVIELSAMWATVERWVVRVCIIPRSTGLAGLNGIGWQRVRAQGVGPDRCGEAGWGWLWVIQRAGAGIGG